jgi:transcriptional regulator with XRE-family HTH domain
MTPHEHATAIGQRIKQARIAAGIAVQAQFARDVGVSYTTLWRYEEGKLTPSADSLQRIAGIAGVSIDWLVTGEGRGPAESAPPSAA